jgi:hypothetical protein
MNYTSSAEQNAQAEIEQGRTHADDVRNSHFCKPM